MTKLAKKDLIDVVIDTIGCTKKDATAVVNALVETTTKTLTKGGEVEVSGFGKFIVKKRKARKGINPSTGETIKIAASKVPAFKAAKALKDAVK